MGRLRLLALPLLAAAALLAAAPAYADDPAATDTTCAGADLQPADGNIPQVAQATLCLLNLERGANSLPPLQEQGLLTQASAAYSARMVAQQFFDHVSPDGATLLDRLTAVGYLGSSVDTWAAGENIAWGTGDLSTPRSIVQAWMNSPPHRENILDRTFRDIGLGVAVGVPQQGAGDGATYTTDFGVRELTSTARTDASAAVKPSAAHNKTTPKKTATSKKTAKPSRCARTARHGGKRRDGKRSRKTRRSSSGACVRR